MAALTKAVTESEPSCNTKGDAVNFIFAENLTRGFVLDEESYSSLDSYVNPRKIDSAQPPLILCGAQGCGKSSLLASWTTRLTRQELKKVGTNHTCLHFTFIFQM